ncbi:Retrovirus-related Pol polyprotein from transposon TNT 1-94 [Araneus ventricosus]|uniref:Retrovirus-related Pol polyprotein from transposon TNT 1-94 n=1 Tax=Araneus ventricosus TaxID=182803 RepID=A0A4Y2N0D9_ARAVE|nr:Retrovirus-related Pol polyprotein from transposon TNT 1-94 [Araneus ventricosus]
MMKTRKVWELVDPPANKTEIGSEWVYNIKHDEKNKPKKYKARLVTLGFKQKAGIDYGEIFSPVVNFSVVKLMFIVLVLLLGWNHVHLDVKSAYLYGKLNEKMYLKQSPGVIVKDAESKVYLFHKALYGLHQSGRSWNCELDHILKDLKFDKLLWSNCLYENKDVILVIYVHDIIVFGKTLNDINKTIDLIKSKLDLTELGPAKYLFGVNFEMNKDLFMHQKTYIEKLMIKFKELPKSNVNLPIKLGSKLPEKIEEKDIVENELMSKFPYRSLIGCLSFMVDRTRPDISFSVNLMSQFSNGYTFEHGRL